MCESIMPNSSNRAVYIADIAAYIISPEKVSQSCLKSSGKIIAYLKREIITSQRIAFMHHIRPVSKYRGEHVRYVSAILYE